MSKLIKYKELSIGFFMLIFSIYFFISSFHIKDTGVTSIGPALIPQIVTFSMIFLSIVNIIISIVDHCNGFSETKIPEKKVKNVNYKAVVLTIALMLFYISLFEFLGFIVVTILYLFLQFCVLAMYTKKNYFLFAMITVALTVIVFLFFRKVLYLMLPSGILPF